MALDYKQSAQLRTNFVFQGRIASAALQFADATLSKTAADLTDPITRKEVGYAPVIFMNPNGEAAKLQPIVVQDPAVQAQDLDEVGDSTITDAYLQGAVESSIRKIL